MPHLSGKLGDVLKIQRKFFGKLRLKYLKKHAAAFICISKEIDAELSSIGVSAERKVFIRNGVDTQHFSGETDTQKRNLRLALGYPENSKIVIFVARLVPEKNPDTLVKIWPEILKNHAEARLLILGSGSLESTLLQMAGKQVHVPGWAGRCCTFSQNCRHICFTFRYRRFADLTFGSHVQPACLSGYPCGRYSGTDR